MIRNSRNPESNLVLIGFMGSGKSTVGRLLSKKLALDFLDMDKEIENIYGYAIPHIFEKYGEYYFRGMEARLAEQTAAMKNTVVATGGGVVKNQANMDILAENGFIVYLQTTAEQVYHNTRHNHGRPLLETDDRERIIAELLCQREPLYEKYSHLTLDVVGKSVEEITKEIMNYLATSCGGIEPVH